MPSIRQNTYPDLLPDFRNLAVMARVLVGVNALALAGTFYAAPAVAPAVDRFIHVAAFLEPLLLIELMVLFAASGLIARLPYWIGCAIVIVLAGVLAGAYNAMVRTVAAEAVPSLSRTVVITLLVATALLAYFRLHTKAVSPAAADGAAAPARECGVSRRGAWHRCRRRAGAHRAARRPGACHDREPAPGDRRAAQRQSHGAREHPRTAGAVLRRRGAARNAHRQWALSCRNRGTLPAHMIRVFLADDESPARERLKELLQDIAAEVPTAVAGEARNGVEALERLPASGAQVLLLDIRMPGMDGLELARQLGGLENAPAVIFVTAHDKHALEAFELNALDYLLKPVRASRLAAALKKP